MKFAKLTYKANLDGDCTVEQQIVEAEHDALHGVHVSINRRFEKALIYDLTRTVCNILSNASIKFNGLSTPLTKSLESNLIDIFFQLHKTGKCYLVFDENGCIEKINSYKGNVELIDPAYKISGYTQRAAAEKALEMYGVVTDALFSVIDERGVMGMFSPQKDTIVKPGAAQKLYSAMRDLFGIKKGQRKFIVVETPMTYSGVSIPVKDLDLLLNKKDATGTVARIYGIGEDMIQSGATFDNKDASIIQTYSDYKGLIYGWISQIEDQLLSFRNPEQYEITFTGVPQLQTQPKPNEIPLEMLNTLTVNEKRTAIGYEEIEQGTADIALLSEKLGVGGTQSMIEIIIDPNLTREQKAGALKVLFSLSDIDVNKLLPIQL